MISPALRTSRGIPVDRYDPNLKLYLPGLPGVGATIYDYSLSANHGAITGALWKSIGGIWYLNFDGDDYVNCGSAASLQLTTVTMLCWAKPTNDDAVSRYAFSMPYDAGAVWDVPYIAYAVQRNDAGSGFQMSVGLNVAGTYRQVDSGGLSPINVWKLYAFTFDGTIVRPYVNGVAGTTGSWTGDITYSGSPKLGLGVRSIDAAGEYWIGGLTLGRVIGGTVLTAAQILSIYQQERHLLGI